MGAVLLDGRQQLLRWMSCRFVRFRARLSPATASLARNASRCDCACPGGSGCQPRCRQGRVVGLLRGAAAVGPVGADGGRADATRHSRDVTEEAMGAYAQQMASGLHTSCSNAPRSSSATIDPNRPLRDSWWNECTSQPWLSRSSARSLLWAPHSAAMTDKMT